MTVEIIFNFCKLPYLITNYQRKNVTNDQKCHKKITTNKQFSNITREYMKPQRGKRINTKTQKRDFPIDSRKLV